MRALTLLVMLVAILGAWTWWQNPERVPLDDAARAQAPMSFVTLPDGITAFRLEGRESGPLVVLIHGYSYPSSLWSNTAAALQAAGFRKVGGNIGIEGDDKIARDRDGHAAGVEDGQVDNGQRY